jgi:hypothetical protein
VTVEPFFRLPEYIALRFNLRITHVHRGILLGTGPLIDPGFYGKLMIPLHNLTSNDYIFYGGEGLIWIEFTKLNMRKDWLKPTNIDPPQRKGKLFSLDPEKTDKNFDYYILKALKNQNADTIRSSIPKVMEDAKNNASEAAKSAKRISNIGYIGFITFMITAIIGILTVYNLIQQTNKYVSDASMFYKNEMRDAIDIRITEQISKLLESDTVDKDIIAKIEYEIDKLKRDVSYDLRDENQDERLKRLNERIANLEKQLTK